MKSILEEVMAVLGAIIGYTFAGLFFMAAIGALILFFTSIRPFLHTLPLWFFVALLPVIGWLVVYVWRCLDIKFEKKKPTIF